MGKIKDIHKSDMFGVFVEIGAGTVISNELFKVSGASNTVFMSESPYNKEYQELTYNNTDGGKIRSVSFESVRTILDTWKKMTTEYSSTNDKNYKINTILVSSFQVGDQTNKVSTHGWIGVMYKEKTLFFHISIHECLTRKTYMKTIGKIGVEILYSFLTKTFPTDCCIDIIKDENGNDVDLSFMFALLYESNEENFICIKDGKMARMEDLFRDQKNIVLFKGSFNPIHNGHINSMEVAEEKYESKGVFCISLDTYQKGIIESSELVRRINMIKKLGYSVIVAKSGYFNSNTEYLRQKFEQQIVYVVGVDTINRTLESFGIVNPKDVIIPANPGKTKEITIKGKNLIDLSVDTFKYNFKNIKFFVFNREGHTLHKSSELIKDFIDIAPEQVEFDKINSTQIRKSENLEDVKNLIHEKIYNLLKAEEPE